MTNPQEAMEAAHRIVAKHAAKVAKAAIEWPTAKPLEDTDAVTVARALLNPWQDISTAPKDRWASLIEDARWMNAIGKKALGETTAEEQARIGEMHSMGLDWPFAERLVQFADALPTPTNPRRKVSPRDHRALKARAQIPKPTPAPPTSPTA